MATNAGAAPAPLLVLGLGLPVREAADAPATYAALAHPAIRSAEVLIGGRAQLSLLSSHPAEKLLVGNDTVTLYAHIAANSAAGKRQIALCSGDPQFFGLGARLASILGPGLLRIVPGVSSLQAAAACLGFAWEETRAVSLHGRASWLPLAHALPSGDPVFVLADPGTTPASLAAWMLERGLADYRLHVLENLYGTPEGEIRAARRWSLGLAEAMERVDLSASASGQRVFFLEPERREGETRGRKPWPFGLNDAALAREKGLLTKAPVRAAALAALGIEAEHCVWDLGAGSAAVSLEAARLAWRGQVFAVERDPKRLALMRENRRNYGAANLEIIAGTMPWCLPSHSGHGETDAEPAWEMRQARNETSEGREQGMVAAALPRPHRIFVGGGLGADPEAAAAILRKAWRALLPGGRLVAGCVLLSSLERCRAILAKRGTGLEVLCLQASAGVPLAGDMRLAAMNPVFLVTAEKGKEEGHTRFNPQPAPSAD
jgi:precorrin-6Y C5,15-methyltransferase (decarboxylating)